MAQNFKENFGKGETVIEKLGAEIESLSTDQEALRIVKTKPKAIKRSRHRAATALAASNQVFNHAVLELQGLSFLPRFRPEEFMIKKILGMV